jgi:hypothetical protein
MRTLKLAAGKKRKSLTSKRRNDRRRLNFRLGAEQLEARRMLAVVLPELTTGTLASSLTQAGLSALLAQIPSSSLNQTPPGDTSVLYHAFPQEANDVKVTGDLLNLFLYINEQNDDIFVQRNLPAFNDDLLEDFNFTLEFIAGVEIPVAHLLGLDFPDVEAIVPNPGALTQFLPSEVQDAFNAASQVLGTTIFPALEVFDTEIIPALTVGDLIGGAIPGPVDNLVLQFIDILGGGSRGGILMELLDGNDTADLSELSGVVQEIHGGIGNDILMGGGSTDPLVVLGSTTIGPATNPRIELFGDEGRDTLVVNNRFDVVDYRVHGGSGNDILLVPGSEFNDIIRVVSNAAGLLQRIEFLAPSTTGGVAQSEVQTITLPAGATGTFTLTFGGETTAPINHNATTGAVETALEALSTISGVTVGGTPGAWTVAFDGPGLANTDQPSLAANGTNLTSVGGSVAVDQTVVGGSSNFNERQRVTLPAGTVGGQFALQLGPDVTAAIPANADASAVRAALGALPSVGGTGNVIVTSPNPSGGPWEVEFTAGLAGVNIAPLVAVNSSLVGFASGSSAVTTVNGVTQVNEIQNLTLSNTTGGTFEMTIDGFTTSPPVPYNASPLTLQNLLTALPSVGPGNISVSGSPGNWFIEYTGALAGTNQPFPTLNIASLTGVGASATLVDSQTSVAGVSEQQTLTLTGAANGGSFRLNFGGDTTAPLPFNASSSAVRAALGALPSINGVQNIDVTGAAGGPWGVTFKEDLALTNVGLITISDGNIATAQPLNIVTLRQGGTPVNDVQTISLPFNVSGGTFSLSVGGVPIPANIPANATAAQIELVLEASPSVNDVTVTGPQGGPWAVEFLSPNPGTPAPAITGNGSALTLQGVNLNIAETQSGSTGGDDLLVTTTITEIDGIEQLQIDLGGGDDRVIFEGAPNFSQGVFVNGGDGTDTIEMESKSATPVFNAPIFPDDVAATLQFDGQAIQFADVEGGLTFDAAGNAGTTTVSGTDASNDIRFQGLGGGDATFANDGQVTISLKNFATGSTVNVNSAQGEDTISLLLNPGTQFTTFNVNGDGPDGADALRMEGTAGADQFVLTADATNPKAGNILVGGAVSVNYSLIDELTFIGAGGSDSLTVLEPVDTANPGIASNDLVLLTPQVGNGGSFQWVAQAAGPDSATVFIPVSFQSIENRVFNTGAGLDTFAASTDDLPGVNSSATVVGGNGTSVITFGDQSTTFLHDTTIPDAISMEIGTSVDDVTVTPGVGVTIAVNTAEGADRLTYNASGNNVTWNIANQSISQPGLGDVTYTAVELLQLVNPVIAASSLTVLGTLVDDRITYLPLSATGGRVQHDGPTTPVMTFENFGGLFTIDTGGGTADEVNLLGTSGDDSIVVDILGRTAQVTDATAVVRKPVTLAAGVEILVADGRGGDDSVLVLAAAGGTLHTNIIGGGPLASDRLVVQDVGPGDLILHRESRDLTGGSIQVGSIPPVVYSGTERVDILPLNPITGGTGVDGNGRIVVFHADPFEQNDSLVNSTEVPDLFQSTVKANIGISSSVDAFDTGLNLPGDEDWYRFRAPKVGTFSFEVLFDRIAGLPGGGELEAAVYRADGSLIASSVDFTDGDVVSFSAARLGDYHLRIRGATSSTINIYEVNLIEVDLVGPQVYDPDGAGPRQAIQIPTAPNFNLFDLKDSNGNVQGPTPLVHSLTINLRDILNRVDQLPADLLNRPVPNGRASGDLYAAVDALLAGQLGQIEVRGDANGVIPIKNIKVINATPAVGQIATATVELVFEDPLPDDRFTLTIPDTLVDPAGNAFDGDSNASEPNGAPKFPSGNNVAGGDFVARFTVDSRAELGVYSLGSIYVDTNGNNQFDSEGIAGDNTNEDIVYKLGFQTDRTFAGNFALNRTDVADGFDKVATYGQLAGVYRWLIDTNNNGVPDLVVADPARINGLPFAGRFDGIASNGDEVGLKDGAVWHLDTNHDFKVDLQLAGNMVGMPVVGDFDGDGIDDLGAWADDQFSLDLSGDGIDGFSDLQFTFGFPGVREIPFAADFNGDGLDDLGIYHPDASGLTPGEQSDWYVLITVPSEPISLTPATFGQSNSISTTGRGAIIANAFVPVDPTKPYVLSGDAKSGDGFGGQYVPANLQYFGFASYDADQKLIEPWHVAKFPGSTDTRLAVALNPGDTQIVLQDATGWANAAAAHQRSFAWYGYSNTAGFTYPDYTYTRNVATNFATGVWSPGAINGNVITIPAWTGPAIAAGTAVRNAQSGGNYNYAGLVGAVPDQWSRYQATITGTGLANNQFRPGTAFIKPVVLTNYQAAVGNLIQWRDISVAAVTQPVPISGRVVTDPQFAGKKLINFTPQPFGPDLFASFADANALPVVGNFDPPLTPQGLAIDPVATVGLQATNLAEPFDVNRDGQVSPLDALSIINYLGNFEIGQYAEGLRIEAGGIQQNDGAMYDANNDGKISALDVLGIINWLNRDASAAAGPMGEGEADEIDNSLRHDQIWAPRSIDVATLAHASIEATTRPRLGAEEVFARWPNLPSLDTTGNSDQSDPLEETLRLLAE